MVNKSQAMKYRANHPKNFFPFQKQKGPKLTYPLDWCDLAIAAERGRERLRNKLVLNSHYVKQWDLATAWHYYQDIERNNCPRTNKFGYCSW